MPNGQRISQPVGTSFLILSGLLSNKPLVGAIVSSTVLQMGVAYVPGLQGIFSTRSLSAVDFVVSLALSAMVL